MLTGLSPGGMQLPKRVALGRAPPDKTATRVPGARGALLRDRLASLLDTDGEPP